MQDHQIRIQGSATYLTEDYQESAGLLRRGDVRAADFVTATRPLAQVAEPFELASSGDHVKILVTVGERRPRTAASTASWPASPRAATPPGTS